MKKTIISLSIIGVVAVIAIGATVAYFNDTETSTGNIFVAGSIDLKVDHVKQTYNDIDCKTCSVEIKSDTEDQVVATQDGMDPVSMPHDAELVSWIHPAWTASISGAEWIWATDPTIPAEEDIDVFYTFQKRFEWWGPITDVTLVLDVGGDNSYEVRLNDVWVAGDNTEQNYNAAGQDQYTNGAVLTNIQQGQNTIEFEVKNWLRPQGETWDNPGGLLYKLVIDGQCGDDYFKTYCTLFGEKDLVPGEDYFWRFEDVKPGDQGTNVISLHVDYNDAYVCLVNDDIDNQENVLTETEVYAGDVPGLEGELSDYLKLFIWNDVNGDGQYDPFTEDDLYEGDFIPTEMVQLSLTSGSSDNLGVAWCMGSQTVNHSSGVISCSGSGNQDDAQTDKLVADLILYAEQQRNNSGFSCEDVELP